MIIRDNVIEMIPDIRSDIADCVKEAYLFANKYKVIVKFTFNDRQITVTMCSDVSEIINNYFNGDKK